MKKNIWHKGMVGAVTGSFSEDEQEGRLGTKAIEAERVEQEVIDKTKYRIGLETKLQIGTAPAGSVATGKKWREIAGVRGEGKSIAPAIFDRLTEVGENTPVTIE